ncbi:uncharacterized protein LOC118269845 [Spodoptera frugiperda]|uniref:Uncharacterized protein LOC118269845 n=1 Tax=Spodoptera frugiperda TaxID=7108 RepID=A0A9R0EKU3_SPOFR|nr:uncharacterized protein LOC118269845 [Spodoptera frugiperda]
MFWKCTVFICVLSVLVNGDPITISPTNFMSSTPATLNLDSLKQNMAEFRECIDNSLANVAGDVNEVHLRPLIGAIGDHINRFSRAYDELLGVKQE